MYNAIFDGEYDKNKKNPKIINFKPKGNEIHYNPPYMGEIIKKFIKIQNLWI